MLILSRCIRKRSWIFMREDFDATLRNLVKRFELAPNPFAFFILVPRSDHDSKSLAQSSTWICKEDTRKSVRVAGTSWRALSQSSLTSKSRRTKLSRSLRTSLVAPSENSWQKCFRLSAAFKACTTKPTIPTTLATAPTTSILLETEVVLWVASVGRNQYQSMYHGYGIAVTKSAVWLLVSVTRLADDGTRYGNANRIRKLTAVRSARPSEWVIRIEFI